MHTTLRLPSSLSTAHKSGASSNSLSPCPVGEAAEAIGSHGLMASARVEVRHGV